MDRVVAVAEKLRFSFALRASKMTIETFDEAIELVTGLSVAALRDATVDERRRAVEKATGQTMRFTSRFPVCGRGNVLRDRLVTHAQAEAAFLFAVRDE